jgi:CPA1 family monovalent cation:H+ antiporter
VSSFEATAVLLCIAAVCGYLNYRFLRLPATTGTLAIALLSSLGIVAIDRFTPATPLQRPIVRFMQDIDFNELLMRGMLSFLLFAAALHVDLDALRRNKWTIATLSTVGVLMSTGIVGWLTWWAFAWFGIPISFAAAMVFGALISPTDPVAVVGLLRELKAPDSLEAQIAGESLFNDGVGVVVFLALVSLVAPQTDQAAAHVTLTGTSVAIFFLQEVGGGVLLGLVAGSAGYHALKQIEDHPLELLITLAVATGVYAASFHLAVSGPIAVVVAGLFIGNPGRNLAMSNVTRNHVDAFWRLMDYILNAVLFLAMALQVFGVPQGYAALKAGLISIPIALFGRLVSVAVPVTAMRFRAKFMRGLVPILTWSGLRGGISIALALSLPQTPDKGYLLAATYAVVVFSTLVQGLTVRRLLVWYGVAGGSSATPTRRPSPATR